MSKSTSSLKEKSISIPPDVADRLDGVVLKMFSSLDFHCVDMRSIAREAAMSFATIYRYFENKEKLLFWFIARWLEPLSLAAREALETDKPLKEKLYDRLAVNLNFYEKNPNVGRVIFLTVPLERWMRDETFAFREPSRGLLEIMAEGQKSGELRSDVPTINLLDAYTAMFNRTFLMWEYRERRYPLTSQLDAVFAILWNGIKTSR